MIEELFECIVDVPREFHILEHALQLTREPCSTFSLNIHISRVVIYSNRKYLNYSLKEKFWFSSDGEINTNKT